MLSRWSRLHLQSLAPICTRPPWWVMACSPYVPSIRKVCAPAVGTFIGWWWWWYLLRSRDISAVPPRRPHFTKIAMRIPADEETINSSPSDRSHPPVWAFNPLVAFNDIHDKKLLLTLSVHYLVFNFYLNNWWTFDFKQNVTACTKCRHYHKMAAVWTSSWLIWIGTVLSF
jgi:hypothetical protein